MPKPAKKLKVEAFRPGSHTDSGGARLTFTADDVRAMAEAYDFATAPAPIVVGHPKTDDPAFGWCESFEYDAERQRLIAHSSELSPTFAEAVEDGRYKRVSIALFSPDHPSNPKPGVWYPRHLGFLGAAAPAVTGLRPVAFADDGEHVVEIEFAASGWAVKDLFTRLRDYWIDKFGLEEADKALPSYLVSATETPDPVHAEPAATYSTPQDQTMPNANTTDYAAELAAANERIRTLEAAAATAARTAAVASAAAFCATLVQEHRLTPAERPALEAALVAIDATPVAEFAAADGSTASESPSAIIRRVLGTRNPVVSGSEQTPPADERPAPASFSAPAGMTVDPADAALYARAKEYQTAHPGVEFAAAVRAVLTATGNG